MRNRLGAAKSIMFRDSDGNSGSSSRDRWCAATESSTSRTSGTRLRSRLCCRRENQDIGWLHSEQHASKHKDCLVGIRTQDTEVRPWVISEATPAKSRMKDGEQSQLLIKCDPKSSFT